MAVTNRAEARQHPQLREALGRLILNLAAVGYFQGERSAQRRQQVLDALAVGFWAGAAAALHLAEDDDV